MNNYSEVIETIVNTILTKVKKAIEDESHYDKTFTATVIQKDNDNSIIVFLNGQNYFASTTVGVKVGDSVRVCAPCNNWSDLFVVENKSRR